MFNNSFSTMPKKRTLTTQLDEDLYAEFSAATLILRARSISTLVHSFVIETIRRAKAQVSEEEFVRIAQEQKEEIERRSATKAREQKLKGVPSSTIKLTNEKDRTRGYKTK